MPIRGTNILSMFGVDFISPFFLLPSFLSLLRTVFAQSIGICNVLSSLYCMHTACICMYIVHLNICVFCVHQLSYSQENRIIKRSPGTNSFAITYFLRVVYCFSSSVALFLFHVGVVDVFSLESTALGIDSIRQYVREFCCFLHHAHPSSYQMRMLFIYSFLQIPTFLALNHMVI